MNRAQAIVATLVLLSSALSCKAKSSKSDDDDLKTYSATHRQDKSAENSPVETMAMPAAMEAEEMAMDDSAGYGGGRRARPTAAPKKMARVLAEKKEDKRVGGPGKGSGGILGGGEQGPAPRAWFPETFLFDPLVITDDTGNASVSVRVPDRLTTWRILGLAHSRNGQQTGTSLSFEGSLPAYVDPIVPSFLRAGDSLSIPVQLINNSDEAIETKLSIEVEGGSLKTSSWQVSIPKRSSAIRYAEVSTKQAGQLRLMARMGERDVVIRTLDVLPVGKAVSQNKSGTLAAPREFSLTGAKAAGASKGIARLTVFPGALALLRSELSASVHRGGVASDAFALLLAGKAPALLKALGDEADTEALRKLTITATQKVMKHARVLSIANAALIAEAARSHPGNPVLERLASRAISTIESSQSPDGTCGGQSGWTLQRLLVATADCARAAKDSPNVVIRAKGAFERHSKEISDPYTAAAILASNGANGEFAKTLQTLILDSITAREDGSKYLVFPQGVVRADGQRPSVVEATALAVLALQSVDDAPLADLGATILAAYSPSRGWGDGRTNLVAMEAAIALFGEPIPKLVKIELRKDGEIVASGNLEQDKIREALHLSARDLDITGAHQWSISATPAVPGLGFSLTTTSWTPWKEESAIGTELAIEVPDNMRVGKAAEIGVQAIAPSGTPFQIKLALPAGFQVDDVALQTMVASGALSRFEKADGQVTLHVAPLQPAKRFNQMLRVIPTLAGSLQSGPTSIQVYSQTGYMPPATYLVR